MGDVIRCSITAQFIWKLVAAVSILLLAHEPSCAQDARMSDVELRAAYCLGVVTRQEEKYQADKARTPARDEVRQYFYEEMEKTLRERRTRLTDYLQVKGLLNSRNAKAIELSLRRGTADATQCGIDLEDPIYKGCKCSPNGSLDDYLKCDAKCPAPEACVRVKRCLENFLPF
jgi:hypothetical protein